VIKRPLSISSRRQSYHHYSHVIRFWDSHVRSSPPLFLHCTALVALYQIRSGVNTDILHLALSNDSLRQIRHAADWASRCVPPYLPTSLLNFAHVHPEGMELGDFTVPVPFAYSGLSPLALLAASATQYQVRNPFITFASAEKERGYAKCCQHLPKKSGRPSQQTSDILDTALNNSKRVSTPALTYLDGGLEASEIGGPRTHLPFL
jgi:hypothetical protein